MIVADFDMKYIDTDVLIHALVDQGFNLHLKVNLLIDEMITENQFLISWLNLQETGFVLAKLNKPASFISLKINYLIDFLPVQYSLTEYSRAMELAEIIGYKNFNDCLHVAIAEQYCSDLYTCNYKDFKNVEPHTTLKIHYLL